MKLGPAERETVITLNDEVDIAYIHTRQRAIWGVLKKRGYKPVNIQRDSTGIYGMDFEVPQKCISFRAVRPPLSAKKQAVMVERGKRLGTRMAKMPRKPRDRTEF